MPFTGRQKNIKISRSQKQAFTEYVGRHNSVLCNRNVGERKLRRQKWTEITNILNALGPQKTQQQWKKCWQGIKVNTRMQTIRDIRQQPEVEKLSQQTPNNMNGIKVNTRIPTIREISQQKTSEVQELSQQTPNNINALHIVGVKSLGWQKKFGTAYVPEEDFNSLLYQPNGTPISSITLTEPPQRPNGTKISSITLAEPTQSVKMEESDSNETPVTSDPLETMFPETILSSASSDFPPDLKLVNSKVIRQSIKLQKRLLKESTKTNELLRELIDIFKEQHKKP